MENAAANPMSVDDRAGADHTQFCVSPHFFFR
jgi:hypothetical protein